MVKKWKVELNTLKCYIIIKSYVFSCKEEILMSDFNELNINS